MVGVSRGRDGFAWCCRALSAGIDGYLFWTRRRDAAWAAGMRHERRAHPDGRGVLRCRVGLCNRPEPLCLPLGVR
jgi:hypothetical protein